MFASSLEVERGWPADRWRELLAAGPWFVAHPLGLVGGAVAAPDRAELHSMWVSPSARGQGVGAALVDAVADWAAGQGAVVLEARVFDDNAAAIALYERCGFVVAPGTTVSRWHPPRTWRTWTRVVPSPGRS